MKVIFKDHSSYIIFNIIRTSSSPIILGLSWLEKYNPSIDWKLQRMSFPIKHSKSKPSRKPRIKKPLFIGARAYVRSSKEGILFVIYAAPTSGEKNSTTSIREQCKDFEDVF